MRNVGWVKRWCRGGACRAAGARARDRPRAPRIVLLNRLVSIVSGIYRNGVYVWRLDFARLASLRRGCGVHGMGAWGHLPRQGLSFSFSKPPTPTGQVAESVARDEVRDQQPRVVRQRGESLGFCKRSILRRKCSSGWGESADVFQIGC